MYLLFEPRTSEPVSPLTPEDYDALDAILQDMRERMDETPSWEFCEGFMVALICCRRAIAPSQYLPVLLGLPGALEDDFLNTASFADEAQMRQFAGLWTRRWGQICQALDTDVDTLEDERTYVPEVFDQRAAVLMLDPAQQAQFVWEALPSLGQFWAMGFLSVVEFWPEEWVPPRDKALAQLAAHAMTFLEALSDSDDDEPLPNDQAPASASQQRWDDFAQAIWGVYDLRQIARELGPRVPTFVAADTPGRNDPCVCGSEKKYKKCCGA